MTDDDDRPMVVTTRCRHFWRKRNPIPTRSPITFDHRISLPPRAPMCRPCAGIIELRPMTTAEFDDITRGVEPKV